MPKFEINEKVIIIRPPYSCESRGDLWPQEPLGVATGIVVHVDQDHVPYRVLFKGKGGMEKELWFKEGSLKAIPFQMPMDFTLEEIEEGEKIAKNR